MPHKLLELELLAGNWPGRGVRSSQPLYVNATLSRSIGIESLDKLPKLELEDALLAANTSPDIQEGGGCRGSEAPQE